MAEYKQQKTARHQCPNCGATLVYDPESGKMHCNHCDGEVEFEKSNDVRERDFEELVTFKTWKDSDVATFRCANCGAVEVVPRTSIATTCPYCSAPVVISDDASDLVKPDTIIPFEISAENASKRLTSWLKSKLFISVKFRKKLKIESVRGVYVPAWTFDADTASDYHGTVGYHRTRTVRRDGKTYTESYTEWRSVRGVMPAVFDDIVIRANENVPNEFFNKLMPFSQDKYRVFDDEYLAGYVADHYTLEPLDAFEQAKSLMEAEVRRKIKHAYHADELGRMSVDLHVVSKSFKYVFLPVYIASTRHKNKVYNQYVSGMLFEDTKENVRICGNFPISPWKVLLAVLAGIGVCVGMFFLLRHSGFFENFAAATRQLGSVLCLK